MLRRKLVAGEYERKRTRPRPISTQTNASSKGNDRCPARISHRSELPKELDGFRVEIDAARSAPTSSSTVRRSTSSRCRSATSCALIFEALDEDPRVRVIVLRAVGEHFSSGGNINGFMEATPEHVSKLAWNIAAPARCAKPVIAANRGYCFGVGFETVAGLRLPDRVRDRQYALPEQKLGQIPGSGGSARLQKMVGITRTKDIVMRSRRIPGKQALEWGIATECVADAELEAATDALVDELRDLLAARAAHGQDRAQQGAAYLRPGRHRDRRAGLRPAAQLRRFPRGCRVLHRKAQAQLHRHLTGRRGEETSKQGTKPANRLQRNRADLRSACPTRCDHDDKRHRSHNFRSGRTLRHHRARSGLPEGPARTPRHLTLKSVSAGTVAAIFGCSGPALIVIGAAEAGGLTSSQTVSWLFAIYFLGGLISLVLAPFYMQPVVGAYSIPGAAILVGALTAFDFNQAVGAFIMAGVLVLLLGLSGVIGRVMRWLPMPIVMAMIAGALIRFGTGVVTAVGAAPLIVGAAVVAFFVVMRFVKAFPPVLAALIVGVAVAALTGSIQTASIDIALAAPTFTVPTFTLDAFLAISVPLAILVIGAENAQATGVLMVEGYRPPINAMTVISGVGGILAGLLGGHNANIAGPMTAICSSEQAGEDKGGRYAAAVVNGVLFAAFGIVAGYAVPHHPGPAPAPDRRRRRSCHGRRAADRLQQASRPTRPPVRGIRRLDRGDVGHEAAEHQRSVLGLAAGSPRLLSRRPRGSPPGNDRLKAFTVITSPSVRLGLRKSAHEGAISTHRSLHADHRLLPKTWPPALSSSAFYRRAARELKQATANNSCARRHRRLCRITHDAGAKCSGQGSQRVPGRSAV